MTQPGGAPFPASSLSLPSVPSLPPPFCPGEAAPPAVAALRHEWMLRNAPVLLQPSIDIAHGNGLLCGFYWFSGDDSVVVLSVVYEGEASWEAGRATAVNRFGSLCYRTHNYRTYGRTADIDHIAFHHVALQPSHALPHDWLLLHTTDASALQSWSRGSRLASFLHYYSLMHHYELDMHTRGWRQWHDHWTPHQQQQHMLHWHHHDTQHAANHTTLHERLQAVQQTHDDAAAATVIAPTAASTAASTAATTCSPLPPPPPTSSTSTSYRPVVYINTGNHLMAPFNTNPHTFPPAAYTVHSRYPLYAGDRAVAERFATLAVQAKWTLYKLLPACLYHPGGRERAAERRAWARRMHHSVLLEGRQEEERRRRDEAEVAAAAGGDRGSAVEAAEQRDVLKVDDGSGHVLAVVQSMDSGVAIEQSADER